MNNHQMKKASGSERRTMWQKIDRWAWRNDHMAIAEFASRRMYGSTERSSSHATQPQRGIQASA